MFKVKEVEALCLLPFEVSFLQRSSFSLLSDVFVHAAQTVSSPFLHVPFASVLQETLFLYESAPEVQLDGGVLPYRTIESHFDLNLFSSFSFCFFLFGQLHRPHQDVQNLRFLRFINDENFHFFVFLKKSGRKKGHKKYE